MCAAACTALAVAPPGFAHGRARDGVVAKVRLETKQPLGVIPKTAFGINTAVWDANLLDDKVPSLLRQAGITILRFPGGSTSDVYHWKTQSITPGQTGYANPADTFDAFMGVVKKAGAQAMVTVNYGSNAAGTGGGDPSEAAAWVRYANITKRYGVKYWEIGNEVYGNGSYGPAWEVDLHKEKGPAAYAKYALQFITKMKAVDPTIRIGVVLTAPGNWPDGLQPSWNDVVLKALGRYLDFVDVHWYAQNPGNESDPGLLASTSSIPGMVAQLRAQIRAYCGERAKQVQIMLTETNSVSYNPGKQTTSPVNALFLADDYMTWLENGAANVDWWDLHNGISTGNNTSRALYGKLNYGDYGVLANATSGGDPKYGSLQEPPADTPFPTYWALVLLHRFAEPGDTMVPATVSQPQVVAHAVKRRQGGWGLLLLNEDPVQSVTVQANLPLAGAWRADVAWASGSYSGISARSVTGQGALMLSLPPYSLTAVTVQPAAHPVVFQRAKP
ncbi:alpha-L-arabinofuranosidase [Alicyclobacillus cellulosilyticus]|uniref:Alpha-L-arabinofuranosidase n=1 Tax=Alicyclobacillus cellulosilyticus TaxID=1003997 RepID=A0A917NG65_9BACL|nr:alpha-L-arabinofuranosidase [Alicyclobacillus cellulosilyticus]